MICQRCGNQNVDYAQFCLACGWSFQPPQPIKAKFGDDPWMRALLPVGKAPLAVVAGWLGLLSMILCQPLGPVAVVLGILALVELNRDREKRGKGRAVFGLVAGSIATLLALAFLMRFMSHR